MNDIDTLQFEKEHYTIAKAEQWLIDYGLSKKVKKCNITTNFIIVELNQTYRDYTLLIIDHIHMFVKKSY